jgi:hypothetical protein
MICETNPLGACRHCSKNKQRCSLMPPNKAMGKTDRHKLNEEWLRNFCIEQIKKQKGKQPMKGHPGVEQAKSQKGKGKQLMQEHPGVGAASEMGVHGLTPESGLSHANSPVITSQSLGPSSTSTPHSPAPVTTAEAPTPLPVIEPAVTTSTHAVANLAADNSAVPVAGPS